MNLQSTDFELFGVPQQFSQDKAVLDARWKELQRYAHPDRHATQGAAALRIAMQWSVRINEAYARLKDPLRRAAYLCELAGVVLGEHDNTAMPAAFLMQQMQWRESLDEVTGVTDIEQLASAVLLARQMTLIDCEHLIDGEHDYVAAAAQVRALMFIERFQKDLNERIALAESAGT